MKRDPTAPATNVRTVFAGLMMGMFLAAVNHTIIAPAMPRIVADLGGMQQYSWIAVSALLASTVTVPVAGKLSDLYGRKNFYVGGIVVFMASSVVAGVAPSFEVFMLARVLEGVGMGTMMPLSQAIIGDLVPARERGKYQGMIGGVYGLASVIGPFLGGWITDALGWRWLFFINLPLGLVALGFIIPFMRLAHARRPHTVDYAGFVTLTIGLTTVLLATVWGGSEYPWGSPQIVGLFVAGGAVLALFLWVESRAAEPVLPLRLWRNDIFTFANLATAATAMAMFGAIYFIPVFVQGVLGASVTDSGAVLTPMMLSMVAMSIVSGLLITRTGRYKAIVLLGVVVLGVGLYLLTRMDRATPYSVVIRNMMLIGLGLGAGIQTFVLIVQNAVSRDDLGVATATIQLSRSIGSSIGTAVLGTILTQRTSAEMSRVMSGGALQRLSEQTHGEVGAGMVLSPELMTQLPPEVLEAVRQALAAALHSVFLGTLPFAVLAFAAAAMIREIPLQRTVQAEPAEAGKQILAELNQAGADDAEPVVGTLNAASRGRTGFLAVLLGLVARQEQEGPNLRAILARIGDGDPEVGRQRLRAVAGALAREGDPVEEPGGEVLAELARTLTSRPPDLRERLRVLIADQNALPSAVLTCTDLDTLERIGVAASAGFLLDLDEARGGADRSGR